MAVVNKSPQNAAITLLRFSKVASTSVIPGAPVFEFPDSCGPDFIQNHTR
jgi:hypothetical protein